METISITKKLSQLCSRSDKCPVVTSLNCPFVNLECHNVCAKHWAKALSARINLKEGALLSFEEIENLWTRTQF